MIGVLELSNRTDIVILSNIELLSDIEDIE